jgi:broad-specificity NMP kinase
VDLVVVLRRHPDEMRPALEKRGYSPEKVMENLEAEAIDVTGQEAAAAHERVVEFDGTGFGVEDLCLGILSLDALWVKDYKGALTDTRNDDTRGVGGGKVPLPRRPGEIDFSEAVLGWY